MSKPLVLIGCGKMGGAMLAGWLESGSTLTVRGATLDIGGVVRTSYSTATAPDYDVLFDASESLTVTADADVAGSLAEILEGEGGAGHGDLRSIGVVHSGAENGRVDNVGYVGTHAVEVAEAGAVRAGLDREGAAGL